MSTDAIRQHYGTAPLWDRVQAALAEAGLDGERVEWSAFAPLDEFHTRGLPATRELAHVLAPDAGATVLDVGSGLGGPARLLAAEHGCEVTGIDLSAEFVDVATRLTERAGLAARVRFELGDATALPFPDARFDHAWTQHVAMNIADRERLYAGVRRVLRPGGRFAMYDVVAGGEPLRFPVPWARTPDTSFLLSASQTREAVHDAGFDEVWFQDQTSLATEWFAALVGGRGGASAAPAIGLPVVMGPEFGQMAANLYENLRHGRAGVIALVVAARPRSAA